MLSVFLRDFALILSRSLGRARRWLRSDWRPPVFMLSLVGVIFWLGETILYLILPPQTYAARGAPTFLTTMRLHAWNILGVFILLSVVTWVLRLRKMVVVERFADFTASRDSKAKFPSDGLSVLLVDHLSRLRELYLSVQAAKSPSARVDRPISLMVGRFQPVSAAIKVDDVSDILHNAVSAESRVNLAGVVVPVGAILAMLGKALRGPRLRVSLIGDHHLLVFTAQLTGLAREHSWRLQRPTPTPAFSLFAEEACEELACRIFTDLALASDSPWEAIRSFTRGLAAYQKCLRTSKDHQSNLHLAERSLLECLMEDDSFDLGYYNLGVVYTELNQPFAADVAFENAVDRNPSRPETRYALAWTRFAQLAQFPEGSQAKVRLATSAAHLCDRVLELTPDASLRAKALDLKGLALWVLGKRDRALLARRAAVSAAWVGLCRLWRSVGGNREIDARAIKLFESLAAKCLRHLAVAYAYQGDALVKDPPAHNGNMRRPSFLLRRIQRRLLFRVAVTHLTQAASLEPYDSLHSFELGKILDASGHWSRARDALLRAIAISPDTPHYWALLALAAARHGDHSLAGSATDRVIDSAFVAEREAIDLCSQACGLLGDTTRADRLSSLSSVREVIERDGNTTSALPTLRLLARQHNHSDHCLEFGNIAGAMGILLLGTHSTRAEVLLRAAIDALEQRHPREISRLGLRAQLARALVRQGRPADALREAQAAIILDPLNIYERMVLGEVYQALNDPHSALAAWQNALLRSPEDPVVLYHIGICYWDIGETHMARDARMRAFESAARFLQRALDLAGDAVNRSVVHFWLARLHSQRREYTLGISNLLIVQAQEPAWLLGEEMLGEAYLRTRQYDECEVVNRRVIRKCEERLGRGVSPKTEVGVETGAPMSLAAVLSRATWNLVQSLARRRARMDEGLRLVAGAMRAVRQIDDPAERARNMAELFDARGCVCCEQENYDDAIRALRHSLKLTADPETYLHLAQACEKKLQAKAKREEMASLIGTMEWCCVRISELDVDGMHEEEVAALRARLAAERTQVETLA